MFDRNYRRMNNYVGGLASCLCCIFSIQPLQTYLLTLLLSGIYLMARCLGHGGRQRPRNEMSLFIFMDHCPTHLEPCPCSFRRLLVYGKDLLDGRVTRQELQHSAVGAGADH